MVVLVVVVGQLVRAGNPIRNSQQDLNQSINGAGGEVYVIFAHTVRLLSEVLNLTTKSPMTCKTDGARPLKPNDTKPSHTLFLMIFIANDQSSSQNLSISSSSCSQQLCIGNDDPPCPMQS